ncbi:MtnX-like HAD-IB family phosphatase [Petroclostridium sp. X23]|uniref:MtnX-like HAD-IB family phosphatase n=1 Tax=Petroclostridium sp. X23 TaxID=3045146 RepID=UPI0024AD8E10|nr:MtnX-like HAD-IB family phosphatase [Petroclostridium sp. X23]WHH57815.1 MtnX-like HAD-IB family phosphatase [Petroclostridium sp. X23]
MEKIIFIDFDGTITKKDTCAAMIEEFAKDGWQEINRLWENKELSTEECANATFKLFDAAPQDIINLMHTIEIDEYFTAFLSLCKAKGYEVYVLSDGYDLNIETIFKRYDIRLKYYSNKLLYNVDHGFSIECPHKNASCGKCGNCKTTWINNLKSEGDEVIYIGDGYSDMCPAGIADLVFAKGVLSQYCIEKGIHTKCFENFKDIIESMSTD